jgi:hypothetical protein
MPDMTLLDKEIRRFTTAREEAREPSALAS